MNDTEGCNLIMLITISILFFLERQENKKKVERKKRKNEKLCFSHFLFSLVSLSHKDDGGGMENKYGK